MRYKNMSTPDPVGFPLLDRRNSEDDFVYRFGAYELDARRRILRNGDRILPLPEKIFQILRLLLDADGETVAKEIFFTRVWPDEYVSDANLTQHVFVLRQLLGETARDHAYIVTASGKGYRFAVRVERGERQKVPRHCLRCDRVAAVDEEEAWRCPHGCTFCFDCAMAMGRRCSNCGGELSRRRYMRPA